MPCDVGAAIDSSIWRANILVGLHIKSEVYEDVSNVIPSDRFWQGGYYL